ncbi:MAG: AAA family ATPase [Marvinbryantia sp.]|uniref:AAA family ATPase n=1 Tax=Marvinbryantia sp. TaxID=2496532 RepID=UPI00399A39AD
MEIGKKRLPIGIESFQELQTENFYYADKTSLIKDLLTRWAKVNLFTRPRRFGKSLNMSMLKCFFEIGGDKTLFDGLKISQEKELCETYMGQFPVISITLKGVDGLDFITANAAMRNIIGKEALRFQFLLESDRLTEKEKEMYSQLIEVGTEKEAIFSMPDSALGDSLQTLSQLLAKHYGRKVILLIDEYDVPLDKSFQAGYYEEMVALIRGLFGNALKTNDSLQFAVLTGCLRISKESIFTGLNNLKVLSIAEVQFEEAFGFTDREVREMLEYYGLSDHYEEMKEWYDGYQFGNVEVYCPWDVINYCDALRADPDARPKNYWINTSSNEVVRRFIRESDKASVRREIENLVAGEKITKEIHQELTYKDMYDSIDNLWSVLFTTGYLTQRGKPEGDRFQLAIPNMEIRKIFTTQIMEFFKENVPKNGEALKEFCDALINGNAEGVEKRLGEYLKRTISIRDTFVKKQMKENFYHGILLGILGFEDSWSVSSNKESGDGYSDILVETDDGETGIILELKYAQDGNLDAACQEALDQIERKRYEEALLDEGIDHILKYGIAFYKKRCRVMFTGDVNHQ